MKKSFSVVILVLLVFIPGFLSAQREGHSTNDTLQSYTDSVVTDTVVDHEAMPSEDYGEKTDTEEKKNNYFLPKQLPATIADSLLVRTVNDSQKAAMARDDNFWYANKLFKKKEEEKEEKASHSFTGSNTFQTLLWVLIIGGFIAFLIIYLGNSNVRLFRKTRMIGSEEEDVETDDIFAINYQKEIDKAIAAGNYRLAVRLLFLRALRSLSDKNIIQYAQGKTNFDYLMQISNTPLYKQFFRLTRSYEYVWYGLFELDKNKFDLVKNDFTDFEQQL